MIALDPKQRVELTLASDHGRLPAERPTFIARHLTARNWLACERCLDDIKSGEDGAAAIERLCEALGLGLVGWRNISNGDGQPRPFDVSELPELLTVSELWELVGAMFDGLRLAEADLKKSALPSGSGTAAPAETVQPDG